MITRLWHWIAGHDDLLYERDRDGTLLLVCPKCRYVVRLVTP